MGLLKKKKKKKSLDRISSRRAGGDISGLRPRYGEKLPPCTGHCPSGNDIRGWLTVIAQRDKLGLSLEEAMDMAWLKEVETNPFPSIMGRICPHPCESSCNRVEKDGAVAINSVERTIGDWGIERSLKLKSIDNGGPYSEKIAVIGSGPSGLSCAYQLARRGYKVTVFESFDKPGGMLRYGIPKYRLPREIIDSEVQRIIDLGVEIKCGVTIGKDLMLDDLKNEFDAVFVGIGAHKGRTMGIPGEEGSGVYTGTDFLNRANSGKPAECGDKVVVVGGGDTAIDAARVSLRLSSDVAGMTRRMGAHVTVLYRRTRKEMPAIEREIVEAMEEGIDIVFLAAPVKVIRDESGKLSKLLVQRMELGEPDSSGRRRPIPIEGDVYEMEADTLIEAVSQQPDWSQLGAFNTGSSWLETDEWGHTDIEGIWSGGDVLSLGLATISIGQGRKAAQSIESALRNKEVETDAKKPLIGPDRIRMDWYDPLDRAKRSVLGPEERLARPMDEVDSGITWEQTLEEVKRCFSCGKCFGCENCWMYCQNSCFSKAEKALETGFYYDLNVNLCDGCKKCGEECPCGYIDLV
jgi:NADPH-dependent glutamate synthase beta subunit-like oxidoreductase/Pyruvate/2-oxoacid:ferredoxin oxidoreductase delta subunit